MKNHPFTSIVGFLVVFFFFQVKPSNPYVDSLRIAKSDEDKIAFVDARKEKLQGKERHQLLDAAITLAEANNWHIEASDWLKWKGIQYYYDGKYPETLETYQKALDYAEKSGSKVAIGKVYNELGVFSSKQTDYEKSTEYFNESEKACTEGKDTLCLISSFNNHGQIYSKQGKHDDAKVYYLRALDLCLAYKDSVGLGYVYNSLADVAAETGDFETAITYVQKSTDIRSIIGDTFGAAVNICNMGEITYRFGKTKKALAFFEESLRRAEPIGYADFTQWILEHISKCQADLGNMDEAHSYLKRSYELKDSILNVKKQEQITEMETKYDTEKKEQQIIAQQRRFNLGIIGAIGLFLIGLLTFLYYRSRQQIKFADEQQKYQKRLLENSVEVQESERKRIAKDLHDGVGQQLTGLKMAMQQLSSKIQDNTNQTTVNKLTNILDEATTDIRNISHQMMPRSLSEFGLAVALEDMVEKSLENSGLEYSFSNLRAEGRFDEKVEVGLYRIAQELINNTLKHAQAKEVDVQLLLNKTHLILVVEDDGIGFNPEDKGSGHGMMNLNSRSQAMGGQLNIDSKVGKGTVTTVRVSV